MSLLVLLFLGGGAVGALWWMSRPETLYASAQQYYAKAEAANQGGNLAAAKGFCESADKQLQTLLDPKKAPGHTLGWYLRYKVLNLLAVLTLQDEEEHKTPAAERISGQIMAEAVRCAAQAATNPQYMEAQGTMLNYFFGKEDFPAAYRYASNLLQNPPSPPLPLATVKLLQGAHYVVGLMALQSKPLRPDETLEHVHAIQETIKQWKAAQSNDTTSGQSDLQPLWREIGLEARALYAKSEMHRQRIKSSGVTARRAPKDEAREELQSKLPAWLERVRQNLDETVPATGTMPARPVVAGMSSTNTRGLLDFLLLTVQIAENRTTLREYIELFLTACEKMVETNNPQNHCLREVASHVTSLTEILDTTPLVRQPSKAEMAKLDARINALSERALSAGVPLDPNTFRRLAERAVNNGQKEAAARLIQKGLEAATVQHWSADNPVILRLHYLGAALALQQKKPQDAEPHLAALQQQKRQDREIQYLFGQNALLDGRLDDAIRHLEAAARVSDRTGGVSPTLTLALLRAYLARGNCAAAIPQLHQLQDVLSQLSSRPQQEQELLRRQLPTPTELALRLFHCYLAVNNLQQALQYQTQLKDTPAEPATYAELILFYLKRAIIQQAKDSDAGANDLDAAWRVLDDLPKITREHPLVVRAEADLLLHQPEFNRPLVASALLSLATVPVNPAPLAVETLRLEQGLMWNIERAEKLMWTQAMKKDDLAAQLMWVKWLFYRGRLDAANDAMVQLEPLATSPTLKRQLQLQRAFIQLRRGQSNEVAQMISTLESQRRDVSVDVLDILLARSQGKITESEKRLTEALNRHEDNGLLYCWQGATALTHGQLREALHAYDRALHFTAYSEQAGQGMYRALHELMAKESPQATFDETLQLLQNHPNNQYLLLACAEAARILDIIEGKPSMSWALQRLQEVLERYKGDSTPALFLAALQWTAANRTDRARKLLTEVLQRDPKHQRALTAALRLALQDEDWENALKLVQTLEKLQTDSPQLRVWHAEILAAQGETKEARAIFHELIKKYPQAQMGYLGLARLAEKAKDYREALTWVQRWRQRMPDDLLGLPVHLRILCEDGQKELADKLAKEFMATQMKRLQAEADANERQQPAPKNEEEKQRRQQQRERSLLMQELIAVKTIIGGFQGAKMYTWTEPWIQYGLRIVEKLPESDRKQEKIPLQLDLATSYMEQANQQKDATERTKFMDKAIDTYYAIYQQVPGHFIAGNNLAWLLNKERHLSNAALQLAEEVRKGRYSQKPISGDRLPTAFLDTLGIIYRDSDHYDKAVKLFTEALENERYQEDPNILLNLGRSQMGLRQVDQADKSLTLAMKMAAAKIEKLHGSNPEREAKLRTIVEEARKELGHRSTSAQGSR